MDITMQYAIDLEFGDKAQQFADFANEWFAAHRSNFYWPSFKVAEKPAETYKDWDGVFEVSLEFEVSDDQWECHLDRWTGESKLSNVGEWFEAEYMDTFDKDLEKVIRQASDAGIIPPVAKDESVYFESEIVDGYFDEPDLENYQVGYDNPRDYYPSRDPEAQDMNRGNGSSGIPTIGCGL